MGLFRRKKKDDDSNSSEPSPLNPESEEHLDSNEYTDESIDNASHQGWFRRRNPFRRRNHSEQDFNEPSLHLEEDMMDDEQFDDEPISDYEQFDYDSENNEGVENQDYPGYKVMDGKGDRIQFSVQIGNRDDSVVPPGSSDEEPDDGSGEGTGEDSDGSSEKFILKITSTPENLINKIFKAEISSDSDKYSHDMEYFWCSFPTKEAFDLHINPSVDFKNLRDFYLTEIRPFFFIKPSGEIYYILSESDDMVIEYNYWIGLAIRPKGSDKWIWTGKKVEKKEDKDSDGSSENVFIPEITSKSEELGDAIFKGKVKFEGKLDSDVNIDYFWCVFDGPKFDSDFEHFKDAGTGFEGIGDHKTTLRKINFVSNKNETSLDDIKFEADKVPNGKIVALAIKPEGSEKWTWTGKQAKKKEVKDDSSKPEVNILSPEDNAEFDEGDPIKVKVQKINLGDEIKLHLRVSDNETNRKHFLIDVPESLIIDDLNELIPEYFRENKKLTPGPYAIEVGEKNSDGKFSRFSFVRIRVMPNSKVASNTDSIPESSENCSMVLSFKKGNVATGIKSLDTSVDVVVKNGDEEIYREKLSEALEDQNKRIVDYTKFKLGDKCSIFLEPLSNEAIIQKAFLVLGGSFDSGITPINNTIKFKIQDNHNEIVLYLGRSLSLSAGNAHINFSDFEVEFKSDKTKYNPVSEIKSDKPWAVFKVLLENKNYTNQLILYVSNLRISLNSSESRYLNGDICRDRKVTLDDERWKFNIIHSNMDFNESIIRILPNEKIEIEINVYPPLNLLRDQISFAPTFRFTFMPYVGNEWDTNKSKTLPIEAKNILEMRSSASAGNEVKLPNPFGGKPFFSILDEVKAFIPSLKKISAAIEETLKNYLKCATCYHNTVCKVNIKKVECDILRQAGPHSSNTVLAEELLEQCIQKCFMNLTKELNEVNQRLNNNYFSITEKGRYVFNRKLRENFKTDIKQFKKLINDLGDYAEFLKKSAQIFQKENEDLHKQLNKIVGDNGSVFNIILGFSRSSDKISLKKYEKNLLRYLFKEQNPYNMTVRFISNLNKPLKRMAEFKDEDYDKNIKPFAEKNLIIEKGMTFAQRREVVNNMRKLLNPGNERYNISNFLKNFYRYFYQLNVSNSDFGGYPNTPIDRYRDLESKRTGKNYYAAQIHNLRILQSLIEKITSYIEENVDEIYSTANDNNPNSKAGNSSPSERRREFSDIAFKK